MPCKVMTLPSTMLVECIEEPLNTVPLQLSSVFQGRVLVLKPMHQLFRLSPHLAGLERNRKQVPREECPQGYRIQDSPSTFEACHFTTAFGADSKSTSLIIRFVTSVIPW